MCETSERLKNIQASTVPTIKVEILIAGDILVAKQVCREWCMEHGGCVTVEPVDYIYTGGEEAGMRVGFINYGRFPSDETTIMDRATQLGDGLMAKMCQTSYSLVGTTNTEWRSIRHTING